MQMKFDKADEVPVFAASCGATCYKFGEEIYVDLMFFRPIFDIAPETEPATHGNSTKKTDMHLKRVSSVTLTKEQAKALISAIQDQLGRVDLRQ